MIDTSQETELAEHIARIDGDALILYLAGVKETKEGKIRGDVIDFERQIVAPRQIRKTIQEMYQSKRAGVSGGGKVTAERMEEMSKKLDNIIEGAGDLYGNQNTKDVASVEQARVIFYDVDDGEIKDTKSSYGTETEGDLTTPFLEARERNGLPLIAVHTHPKSGMPSAPDYKPILVGLPEHNLRYVGAILILNDDNQILAVASKDTPILTGEEADKVILGSMRDTDDKCLEVATQFMGEITELSERKRLISLAEEAKNQLGEAGENADKLMSALNIREGELEEIDKLMESHKQSASNAVPKVINSDLISFANEMRVKLYISTDGENFKEFSA